MYIDSHCHLDRIDLAKLDTTLNALVDAATARGVEKMLCVCIDLQQFEQMRQAVESFANVFMSAGVHPLHVEEQPFDEEALSAAALRKKIVAIGETGLDYYYSTEHKTAQKESFAGHLKLAGELGLPCIVHTRDARQDTLACIDQYGHPKTAGVLHCFTESLDMAMSALDLNYYISFSGIITFKSAEELRKVVKEVPLERILIETDSPYLAPVPYRGKQNQPAYVVEVAECVAAIKGCSVEKVAAISKENFFQLFKKAA